MAQQTSVARRRYREYMRRVLVDSLMDGKQEQHIEQAAGPQQHDACVEQKQYI
jgi:hypothetical protein